MRTPLRTGKKLLFILTTLALSAARVSADPSISAKVSATEMSLNSSITLTLEVQGTKNMGGTPNLNLPNFQVQAAGQTHSYQWVNGQSSSLVSFNYVLTPTKTGLLQIPSITLNVDGKTAVTNPINVTVHAETAGSAYPSSSGPGHVPQSVQVPAEGVKPLFMTAIVDADRIYVGQQILLRVQFLRRPDVRLTSQARYSEPDITGFLSEPLQQQEYTSNLNGTPYEVTELRYALFPTSDGEFTIGSAEIEVAVRSEPDAFDPNSFFMNFFGRSEVAKLKTRPISIQVRALPKNKPANFSGAVGRFKLNAKVDTNQLEVGKPFNLILTVEGVGNIKSLKEPAWPEPSGFRRYETISTSKIDKDGKFIHGSKEFKILLIPQVSGPLTIPPISFIYFNPAENDYMNERTQEISFNVNPGKLSEADAEAAQRSAAGPAITPSEGVRVMEKDIRFIKTNKVRPVSTPFHMRAPFLIMTFLPPLFALVAFVGKRQATLRIEKASEYRYRAALKSSKKTLIQARKTMDTSDAPQFYGLIQSAISNFVADKLMISASGLLWEDLDRKLSEKNVDDSLKTSLRELFDEIDMARFATSSFTDQFRESILTKAEQLVTKLNEVL